MKILKIALLCLCLRFSACSRAQGEGKGENLPPASAASAEKTDDIIKNLSASLEEGKILCAAQGEGEDLTAYVFDPAYPYQIEEIHPGRGDEKVYCPLLFYSEGEESGTDFGLLVFCTPAQAEGGEGPFFSAVKISRGRVVNRINFEDEGVEPELAMDSAGEGAKIAKADENMDKIRLNFPNAVVDMYIDFEAGQVRCERNFTPADCRDLYAESRDGLFSIYSARGGAGVGDYYRNPVIMVQNSTQEVTYLGNLVSNRQSGAGFFSNGDAYLIDSDRFDIYTIKDGQLAGRFALESVFPLGKIESGEIQHRYLVAARRDPGTGEFLVMYVDLPAHPEKEDYTCYSIDNTPVLSLTYKISQLDSRGNVKNTVDTGVNCLVYLYSLSQVNMYVRGNLVHFEVYQKDELNISAATNLETGKTTVTKNLWRDKI